MKQENLTIGIDCRGNEAFFIEQKHILKGNKLDEETQSVLADMEVGELFFRIIRKGKEQRDHGWIDLKTKEIFQWG